MKKSPRGSFFRRRRKDTLRNLGFYIFLSYCIHSLSIFYKNDILLLYATKMKQQKTMDEDNSTDENGRRSLGRRLFRTLPPLLSLPRLPPPPPSRFFLFLQSFRTTTRCFFGAYALRRFDDDDVFLVMRSARVVREDLVGRRGERGGSRRRTLRDARGTSFGTRGR